MPCFVDASHLQNGGKHHEDVYAALTWDAPISGCELWCKD
jgi:hypothetical protein